MTTYTEINKLLADIEAKYMAKYPGYHESIMLHSLKWYIAELLTEQLTPDKVLYILKKELD